MKEVIEAFEDDCPVQCSDGYTRDICPIVAAWLGDREEHELVASIVKVDIFLCLAEGIFLFARYIDQLLNFL